MFVSIVKSKAKKGKSWARSQGKSRALKHPRIKPAKPYEMEHPFHGGGVFYGEHPAELVGDPIIREPRPSYNLKMGESYREDGKVKSRQKHLYTFSEWDIIDGFMDQEEEGWEHLSCQCFDYEWLEKKKNETFPDVDMGDIWTKILTYMQPIEDPIINGFKQTEEYTWWCKTLKLKKKLKAEQEHKAKQKRKEKEEARQQSQYHQQSYGSNFKDAPPSSDGLLLSKDESSIIKKCYKAMAVQLHPDKGGSNEEMTLLNVLNDRLKAL